MDKKTVLKIIQDFINSLQKKGIKIDMLVLYGSYANMTYHEASDIDLVVVSQSFRGKSFWERVDILSEVIYELFQPIEAVAITPEEWTEKKSFVVDYASTGEIIYKAS